MIFAEFEAVQDSPKLQMATVQHFAYYNQTEIPRPISITQIKQSKDNSWRSQPEFALATYRHKG